MWAFICILAPVPVDVRGECDLTHSLYNFNQVCFYTNLFYYVVFSYVFDL